MTVQMWFYPGLILLLLGFLLITVPRTSLRSLVPFGFVLGGLLDGVLNLIFGNVFHFASYINSGMFDASGQLILAPITWILVIIFFLYFWPRDQGNLVYLYVLAWALLATAFSQVVHFLGLFEYSPWMYPLPMLILFLGRFALAAWVAKPWTNSWT
ncbi:MAG: hypothetical protein M0R49_00655 [Limnochordia bacterium]|jgi:hypothetical protein|nr:hypothetical protein [Limnochordia bacterium]